MMRTLWIGIKFLGGIAWLSFAIALSLRVASAQTSGEFNGFKYDVKGAGAHGLGALDLG
jgi:hypothetical protein